MVIGRIIWLSRSQLEHKLIELIFFVVLLDTFLSLSFLLSLLLLLLLRLRLSLWRLCLWIHSTLSRRDGIQGHNIIIYKNVFCKFLICQRLIVILLRCLLSSSNYHWLIFQVYGLHFTRSLLASALILGSLFAGFCRNNSCFLNDLRLCFFLLGILDFGDYLVFVLRKLTVVVTPVTVSIIENLIVVVREWFILFLLRNLRLLFALSFILGKSLHLGSHQVCISQRVFKVLAFLQLRSCLLYFFRFFPVQVTLLTGYSGIFGGDFKIDSLFRVLI